MMFSYEHTIPENDVFLLRQQQNEMIQPKYRNQKTGKNSIPIASPIMKEKEKCEEKIQVCFPNLNGVFYFQLSNLVRLCLCSETSMHLFDIHHSSDSLGILIE
jgi:hypothetical protein